MGHAMTDEEMTRALRSVGYAAFVDHITVFDSGMSGVNAVAELQERTGWAASACHTRVSRARSVIEAGRVTDALELIAASERVSSQTRFKARALLATV
ncbi:hypothetical protein [Gymnodinialimonas ceratoperidinii]|uniref:Uncharacterized protein n=1 Tax=Gymnodinialimonas ceratoperidinii TaxID=2856823 RepID=A0A8F6TSS6_9RHOB|nr:hypothetical protein [Gymnodinialimonas ceratoperidinii]QXT38307.1 hypothetical protein KYE46_10110 [Gymnodinialimonas ceratoperidinii]